MKPQFASPRAFARALAAALALLAGGAATASAADPVDADDRPRPRPPRRRRRRSSAPRRSCATRSARAAWSSPTRTPDRRSSSPASTASSRRRARATPPTSRSATSRSTAPPSACEEADLAGFRETSRTTGDDGTTYLSWEQQTGGIPNVDGGLKAAVSDDGRLINVTGGPLGAPGGGDVHAGDRRAARVRGRARRAARRRRRRRRQRCRPADAVPAAAARRRSSASATATRTGSAGACSRRRDRRRSTTRSSTRATGKLIRRVNRVRFAAQIRHFDVSPRAESGSSDVSTFRRAGSARRRRRSAARTSHAFLDLSDDVKARTSRHRRPASPPRRPATDEVARRPSWTATDAGLPDSSPLASTSACTWHRAARWSVPTARREPSVPSARSSSGTSTRSATTSPRAPIGFSGVDERVRRERPGHRPGAGRATADRLPDADAPSEREHARAARTATRA